MKLRRITGLVILIAGVMWFAMNCGVFCEIQSARSQAPARHPSTGLSEQEEMNRDFPFMCFAAKVRGWDLFSGEARSIPVCESMRRESQQEMAFAVILISLGLIAFVGPLKEPLAQHKLQRVIFNTSIGALGGGAAFFLIASWELAHK